MKCNEFIYVVLYLGPTCVSLIPCMQTTTTANISIPSFHPSSQRAYKMQCSRELQKTEHERRKNGNMLLTNDIKRWYGKEQSCKSLTTNGRATTTPYIAALLPAMFILLGGFFWHRWWQKNVALNVRFSCGGLSKCDGKYSVLWSLESNDWLIFWSK